MGSSGINALRVLPSLTDYSVLTSVFDHKKGKWQESGRATHPFILVQITRIDPNNRNKNCSPTTTQCLMADSGAQCSLLNFKTVRSMGIDPEKLAASSVSITGVNGKELQSQTRQMHVRIINTSNQEESWEKVYVSEEIKVSLVSKDCLIRLKVLDPSLFLSEKAVRSFSVNQIEDNKDSTTKLSECEKTFYKKDDGSMGCKCPERTAPPDFNKTFYEG